MVSERFVRAKGPVARLYEICFRNGAALVSRPASDPRACWSRATQAKNSEGIPGTTNPNPDNATFRVPQRVRFKARSAGNGRPLVKERSAESGPLWHSLRANRWAAIRGVAPDRHRAGYGRADAPSGLTAQRFVE
jgi:hypothetical protein